jgi:transposase
MKHYVGLDVSMKTTFLCIVDETGRIVKEGKTKTEPHLIADFLNKANRGLGEVLRIQKVGLESGSLSGWLTEQLKKLKIPVICIDARKMAAVLSVGINKTDKNDARGIADAMRAGLYREVASKSPRSVEIGVLMNSRRTLVEQRVQIKNTIRGLLKTYGVCLESGGEELFVCKVKLHLPEPELAKEGIEAMLSIFEKLSKEIDRLTKRVEALAKEDEDVKRLMTIPGVGAVTALAYKVEIDDPYRFKNSRAVGAYLGMTPRQYSSGETHRQGRISKCGSKEMRWLLNEAATVMLTRSKKWNRIKAWGVKLSSKKRPFKQVSMAVGRKLAIVMHQMLLNKTEFIPGKPKEKKLTKENEKIGAIGLARAV